MLPVSTTPWQLATSINDTGGKFAPVSMKPVANNGNNIRLHKSESELEKTDLIEDFFHLSPVSMTQVVQPEVENLVSLSLKRRRILKAHL